MYSLDNIFDSLGPFYRLEYTDENGDEQTSMPMVLWKAEHIKAGLLDDLGIDAEIVED